jgi:uncharacterized protein YbaP (TraB family)
LENSLLWQLTPQRGAVEPSYLFGTMHVRDVRAFAWMPLARQHLAACPVFATEFDFAEADHAALGQALQLPEGENLETLLPRSAWKNLTRYARQELGLTPDHLRQWHPMTANAALLEAVMRDEAPYSVDETLWIHARDLGKRTTGVESFGEQLEILGKISLEQHLRNLTWLVKNWGRQRRRVKKMLDWYRAGDIQQLYRATRRDAKGLRRVLIYDRNERMAQRLIDQARVEPVFCAVGAAHLAGQKGLLRLLKRAGFVVRPVPAQMSEVDHKDG